MHLFLQAPIIIFVVETVLSWAAWIELTEIAFQVLRLFLSNEGVQIAKYFE